MFKLLIPMKILTTLSTIVLLFAIASCDEDCTVPTTVIGEWTWVKSVGGFAGHTITPESEGYTKKLVIDDHFYTEYINDSIDFKTQYDLRFDQDSIFGTPYVIEFDSGGLVAYAHEGNQLKIIEVCADCYTHFYTRK